MGWGPRRTGRLRATTFHQRCRQGATLPVLCLYTSLPPLQMQLAITSCQPARRRQAVARLMPCPASSASSAAGGDGGATSARRASAPRSKGETSAVLLVPLEVLLQEGVLLTLLQLLLLLLPRPQQRLVPLLVVATGRLRRQRARGPGSLQIAKPEIAAAKESRGVRRPGWVWLSVS